MKKLLLTLLAMPLLFASCSNEEIAMSEEAVEVSFTTEIPVASATRATADLTVNKMVCTVFDENGDEIGGLRTTIDITDADNIRYAPRLVKGRSYTVVFWAMKDSNYDVSDMKNIRRATGASASDKEEDYDAFTAFTPITVENATSVGVTLIRPLAQLNIGVTQDDWNAVVNNFNQTPTACTISYESSDAYNALTGQLAGVDSFITRNVPATGENFTVESESYRHIGSCYVFFSSLQGQDVMNVTFTVTDQHTDPIRSDVTILYVPFERNYKTNLVGGLLTGTITYNISLEENYSGDHNKVVP